MLKSKITGSMQEVILPDFPDDDNTTTTATVTKSRRVSFGTNIVKEFIVGSAVSAQCMLEYEQAFPSSDSSNADSSHSAIESGVLDQSTFPVPENQKVYKSVPSVSQPSEYDSLENRPKPPKFSSTICFSVDSPTADMEFTEGCITLAKSILDKKNKEMTVIIQAKPKEPKDEDTPKDEETKYFEGSQFEMSVTRCLKPKENKREEKKVESEKTRIFSKFEDEMSLTKCNKFFYSDESDSSFDDCKENRIPLDMIMRHLDKDDSDLEDDLFNPEKTFCNLLGANPFDLSNESEKLNLNESMDITAEIQPCNFKVKLTGLNGSEKVTSESMEMCNEFEEMKSGEMNKSNFEKTQNFLEEPVLAESSEKIIDRSTEFNDSSKLNPNNPQLQPINQNVAGVTLEKFSFELNTELEPQPVVLESLTSNDEMDINPNQTITSCGKKPSEFEENLQEPMDISTSVSKPEKPVLYESMEISTNIEPELPVDSCKPTCSKEDVLESIEVTANVSEQPIRSESDEKILSQSAEFNDFSQSNLNNPQLEHIIVKATEVTLDKLNSEFNTELEPQPVVLESLTSNDEMNINPNQTITSCGKKLSEFEENLQEPMDISTSVSKPEKPVLYESIEISTNIEPELPVDSCKPTCSKEDVQESIEVTANVSEQPIRSEFDDKIMDELTELNNSSKSNPNYPRPESIIEKSSELILEKLNSELNREFQPQLMVESLNTIDSVEVHISEGNISGEMKLISSKENVQESVDVNTTVSQIPEERNEPDETLHEPVEISTNIEPELPIDSRKLPDFKENTQESKDVNASVSSSPEEQSLREPMEISAIVETKLLENTPSDDRSVEPDTSEESSEVEREPLLVDTKVIESLKEQSKEPGCTWSLEDFRHPQTKFLGWLSFNCVLLESTTTIRFYLKLSKENSLNSCSTVTNSEVSLNEEKLCRLPEYQLVINFGFQQLKKYFEQHRQKVEIIRLIPYFLDQINSFIFKTNSYLRQIYSILTLYPGSRLTDSLLSFRLYSFPIFFSCLVSIDLTNLFRLSDSSLSFENDFGSFDENKIREFFQKCLKCENSLCEFVIMSTKYLFDLEKKSGYISKRGHIKLLPSDLKL